MKNFLLQIVVGIKCLFVLFVCAFVYKCEWFGGWSFHVSILMIILIIVIIFYPELKNIFISLKKISFPGGAFLELDTITHLGSPNSNKNASSNNLTQETYPPENSYLSPIVLSEKELIFKQLSESNMTLESKCRLLIQELAHKNVFMHYYWLNQLIVPEQQEFLRRLNAVEYLDQSVVLEQFNNFLNRTKIESVTADKFMPWIIEQQLVLEQEQGKYLITHKGRDYLRFLISIGHPVMSAKTTG